ncbi:uncharacterized protein LOC121756055 [Salvia splendens]|uniref:uncharacterized protein LOC121756055 n=1 Tax=Salvia splendens TaxID=180675 RepID=UPI001C2549E3|nr:uncharacterized protein LOC121756055 [Salvia splendens]
MEQTYTLEPVAILRWPVGAEELEEYATIMNSCDQAAPHDGVTLKVLDFQGYDVVVRVWLVNATATPLNPKATWIRLKSTFSPVSRHVAATIMIKMKKKFAAYASICALGHLQWLLPSNSSSEMDGYEISGC